MSQKSSLKVLLKKQASEIFENKEKKDFTSWKTYREEIRKKIKLKKSPRVTPLYSITTSTTNPQTTSRNSFHTTTNSLNCRLSQSSKFLIPSVSERRLRSPIMKAKENFDKFYKTITPLKKSKRSLSHNSSCSSFCIKDEDICTSSYDANLQSLQKKKENERKEKVWDVVTIDQLKKAKEMIEEGDLKNGSKAYRDEIRELAEIIIRKIDQDEEF